MKSSISKIIVVDDEPLEAQLIKLGFEKVGIEGEWKYFESGRKFLEYLKRESLSEISLILLDLKMPLMDGKEVLREVHKLGIAGLPIVMFTSSSHPQDIQNCYELGASAFVTKPIQREEYLESLRMIGEFWVNLNVGISY